MPVGIAGPESRRYRRANAESQRGPLPDGAAALRAYADDILGSGDPRLALERAFRWGYRTASGDHVSGLQEQLQQLRQQQDRLLRQIDREDFLDGLRPELDRLDTLDGSPHRDAENPIDRLCARLEAGYASEAAQAGLERLRSDLTASLAETPEGVGRSGAAGGSMRDARSARVDRLRRMVFSGGIEASGAGAAAWRRPRGEASPLDPARGDLALIAELDRVESALDALDAVGSVVALPQDAIDVLRREEMPEIADWLDGWRASSRLVARSGSVPLELPPEVVRGISRDLLRGLFRRSDSPVRGEHAATTAGNAGDALEGSTAWEPGRPIDLDVVGTIAGAIRRGAVGRDGSVRLLPDDILVNERAASVAVSTVLLIDRSRSMGQNGGWVSARKLALALHELIQQSYPRDSLDLVTFSSTAERIAVGALPALPWDRYEHGTHLQRGLALARAMLRQRRAGTRQVVVVTDGEPTLATVSGEDVFASPPNREVLEATMAEVMRCTRERITINVVVIGPASRGDFADQIARVNRGRVFRVSTENLGTQILRDYLAR